MVVRCWPSKRLSGVCTESRILQGCGVFLYWFPRVTIPLSIVWGTLSHVVYTGTIENSFLRVAALSTGVFFGSLAFIAYYLTWRVGPGFAAEIPELQVLDPEAQLGSGDIPDCLQDSVEAKQDGGVRFCNKCSCFKPDRTHHCRQCGACVLRMDHHCPWFSCCVGFRNQKFFIQFLWYVWALCVVSDLVAIPTAYSFFKDEIYTTRFIGINFVFYFMMASVFNLVLFWFGGYTTYLALSNRTTLESMEPSAYRTSLPAKDWRYRHPPSRESLGNIYDVGVQSNCEQIMGSTWAEWLLPIRPQLRLNGTRFPVNEDLRAKAEERAQTEISMHQRKQRWLEEQQGRQPQLQFD